MLFDSRTLALAAGAALAAALPAAAQEGAPPQEATSPIIGTDGSELGSASIVGAAGEGVLITLQVEGLEANRWVAFHIHEGGECDAEGDFESAGGHLNADGSDHGYLADGGPHTGDMPNQWVGSDGVLRAQVFNHMVSLDDGDAAIRGRTVVIHAAPDDYESQPSGDAGDPVACGVIE